MSCGSFARSLTKRSTGGDVQVEGKKKKIILGDILTFSKIHIKTALETVLI